MALPPPDLATPEVIAEVERAVEFLLAARKAKLERAWRTISLQAVDKAVATGARCCGRAVRSTVI